MWRLWKQKRIKVQRTCVKSVINWIVTSNQIKLILQTSITTISLLMSFSFTFLSNKVSSCRTTINLTLFQLKNFLWCAIKHGFSITTDSSIRISSWILGLKVNKGPNIWSFSKENCILIHCDTFHHPKTSYVEKV